jgi:ABC-type dipeptide/oligopeptide/nickel transport system ATPase component
MNSGEAIALVGESGSGKTLTCKAVLRLLNKRQFTVLGGICFAGMELTQLSDRQVRAFCGTQMAIITQNPMAAFDPSQKIGAAMIETLRVHQKVSRAQAQAIALAALEKMGLPRPEALLRSYPYTLSGGMLQRVAIAIALMLEPQLIIADEPTTALDVVSAGTVLDEIARIKSLGIGVLFVTHDLETASKIADRMMVMKDGAIVESGLAEAILTAPKANYTKQLLEARCLAHA